VHDHRALDGRAERVLDGERKCLAGIDHRCDGDAADRVGLGVCEETGLLRRSGCVIHLPRSFKWTGKSSRQPLR
jgi:hypothetical protein